MKTLIRLSLLILPFSFQAQQLVIDTLLFEDFSNPNSTNYQVRTSQGGVIPPVFSSDSAVLSPPCIKIMPSFQFSSYIVLEPISTVGKDYAAIKFKHINKIRPFRNMVVEVSTNNGNSWMSLPEGTYFSTNYTQPNSINSPNYVKKFWGGISFNTQDFVPAHKGFWAEEILSLNGYLNHPNLLIRFNHPSQGSALPLEEGWLIDDILVFSSNCQAIPHNLVMTFPNNYRLALGQIDLSILVNNTQLNYPQAAKLILNNNLKDTIGFHYSINNGQWVSSSTTFGNCVNSSGSRSFNVPNLSPGDTAKFYFSHNTCDCDTTFRIPRDENYTAYIVDTPQAKCGNVLSSGVSPFIIETFPFEENMSPYDFHDLNINRPEEFFSYGRNWQIEESTPLNIFKWYLGSSLT